MVKRCHGKPTVLHNNSAKRLISLNLHQPNSPSRQTLSSRVMSSSLNKMGTSGAISDDSRYKGSLHGETVCHVCFLVPACRSDGERIQPCLREAAGTLTFEQLSVEHKFFQWENETKFYSAQVRRVSFISHLKLRPTILSRCGQEQTYCLQVWGKKIKLN